MTRSQHSPSAVMARRRQAMAVQRRAAGLTFQQIADTLLPCALHLDSDELVQEACDDCRPLYNDKSAARKAIVKALQDEYDLSEQARDELRREDMATTALVIQRMTADLIGAGREPSERASAGRTLLRALDHRARVAGYLAPTRVQVTPELDADIEQALRDLTAAQFAPDGNLL